MTIDPRLPLRPAESYSQPMGPEQQANVPTPVTSTTPEQPSFSPPSLPEVPTLEMPSIEAPPDNSLAGDVLAVSTESTEVVDMADHLEVLAGQMVSKKGPPGPLEAAFAREENHQAPPAA